MTQLDNDRSAHVSPSNDKDAKGAALPDRELSADELEAVAAAGEPSKGDPNSKKPPPPATP
jgi:hypothetical protein